MGYTTDFAGQFTLDKPLDDATFDWLKKLNGTRRMARDPSKLDGDPKRYGFDSWGVDGEYYVDGGGDFGQAREASIINYNGAPKTQPSLWCKWVPTEDRLHIEWDDAEKFYHYVEWLKYMIHVALAPRGYKLNGDIEWSGEERGDVGRIVVEDNEVRTQQGRRLVFE